jgi:hypothetical protein
MRKVILRMNEQEKYEKIKYLVDHHGNKQRVAIELSLTLRQVNRLINLYNKNGKAGFVHGNRLKKPVNTLDQTLSKDIILLYDTKYQECNFNHFKDLLKERENINVSYSLLYNLLMKNGFVSPKIQKATKRRLAKEKLKKDLPYKTEEEIEIIVNHQVSLEDAHPRKERCKYFGEQQQMDASQHLWFGDKKSQLHMAIDDASGLITGGYFEWQETLFGYYNVYKQILINYGIPLGFLTDNRTVFYYDSIKRKTPEKDVLTQFGYACKIFGTDLKTTSVSQSKGRIERVFGTLQSRLIQELRLEGITTIDAANKYLIDIFIPKFNNQFALPIKNFESVFETSPSEEKINYTLAVLAPRKLDNGNAIKYKNVYYQPFNDDMLVCFKPKTECLVIKALNGDLLVTIDDQVYELRELNSNASVSEALNERKETIPKHKHIYIPPMSHPWKSSSFKKQMQKAHTKHVYA